MKRFHVHLAVTRRQYPVLFVLFGVAPTVVQPDYAKWMLEDPRVNFAISQRKPARHQSPGFAGESDAELQAMRGQLAAADTGLVEQTGAACCALSDKYWVTDPQGVAWETFHTLDTIPMYGEDTHRCLACCIPLPQSEGQVSRPRVAFP